MERSRRFPAFLERHSLLLAACFIAFATIRIASTYSEIGITFDEPAHLACGMQYLTQHIYQYEAQHPPLARVMCSLGPYLAGLHSFGRKDMIEEGTTILYENGEVARNLMLDRAGNLPFFIIACIVVYLFGGRYFGRRIAVLATGLFTLTPVILAHAGLGTTDMALTAGVGSTFLMLLIWAEQPTIKHGLLLGLTLGLTILTKFSALVFIPASSAIALGFYQWTKRPSLGVLWELTKDRINSFGAAAFTTAIVIHAGYLFSFGEVAGFSVWLPAPEFFAGIRQVLDHNYAGHPAFLLGQLSRTGWWYYFPVMLSFKTPIALSSLILIGLYVCWKRRDQLACWFPLSLLLGVLIPSMIGRIDIGTRHVMPVYMAFSIIGALGLEYLMAFGQGVRAQVFAVSCGAILVIYLAISGGMHHPDYLSYYTELIRKPENLFVDSDLDWGQGTPLVARRLRQLHVSKVTCSFWYITAEQLRVWPGLNANELDFRNPTSGWIAVSPTYWRLITYINRSLPTRPWFAKRDPIERVGGMLLYYFPPELSGSGHP